MNKKIQVLLDSLESLKPESNGIYIVHTSLFLASPVREDLFTTYMHLREILGQNSTICFPAFTFRNNLKKNAIWNQADTPGEVGALNEYVRKNIPGVRSIHPTHSFFLTGPRSKEINQTIGYSAFGEDSCLNKLVTEDAFNISFGAPFVGGHSFLHVAEEICSVPYRSKVVLDTPCELEDKKRSMFKYSYYARNQCSEEKYHENNWEVAWNEFTASNLINYISTEFGLITLMKCNSAIEFMKNQINQNPFHYAKDCIHSRSDIFF